MESQECYLCKTEKPLEDFIVRRDGIRYRMCRRCNSKVQAKKRRNPKLEHTETHRTCYKCRRLLEKEWFTRRSNGSYFSACKECNKYEFAHLRRSRLQKSEGRFTSKEFQQLLKAYDACPMCGRKWEEVPLPPGRKVPWTADHIRPITPAVEWGTPGTNDISNIQPLCYSCNSRKGNR